MWPFTKAKVPTRITPSIPYIDGERWAAGVGGTVSSITPQQAESLACVLGAVNAIASTVASLPAYVARADDSRADVPDHPLQRLIDNGPNSTESWSDFVENLLASCLLRGNFLADIETNARGQVSALHTLPWANVTPWLDERGELLFDYLPTLPPHAGKRRCYSREDTLFIKDRSDDGVIGVPRIRRAARSLMTAIEIERTSAQFMGNAARPAGTLNAPGKISETTAARLGSDWDKNYSGEGKGRVAVLPEGLEWKALALMSAEDAQIVLLRNFSVADCSRIFQVPPFMLADPSRSTFASAREASRQFAMQALSPWVSKIQRAFRQSVLSSQYRLIIDLGDLLRADPEARWGSWQRARMAGVLSPNDVRLEEGWPASDDPSADGIAPPVVGGAQPPGQGDDEKPKPAADDEKIAHLDQRRGRHGAD